MPKTYFIAFAISTTDGTFNFISNTSPIMWDNYIENAKKFLYIEDIRSDLRNKDNLNVLTNTRNHTKFTRIVISRIHITETNKIEIVESEEFL